MVSQEIIITAGSAYTDIDVFACANAYHFICKLKNISSRVVLPGALNESISPSIKELKLSYENDFIDHEKANYVLVDVSNPGYFPAFVHEERILEVYDHHWGHEEYWKAKIGNGAKIEFVGSCATLMYEQFVKEDLASKIDNKIALLLYTAILSNTLNLFAQITTDRDRNALYMLSKQVPNDWGERYFNEVSESILQNPERAMERDTKHVTLGDKEYAMIQVELWNSKQFITDHYDKTVKALRSLSTPYAFLTSPSILEGVNYLVALNDVTKSVLSHTIGATFENDLGQTKKLWLRKEIIKAIGSLYQ